MFVTIKKDILEKDDALANNKDFKIYYLFHLCVDFVNFEKTFKAKTTKEA